MQINRLFEIIYLLLGEEKYTASALAERFEVSVRTIYRDIEVLSSAGIPIYMERGRGGGISLLPDYILNKTVLTEEEKSDVLSALKAVNSLDLSNRDTAASKLFSLLGDKGEDWIEVDFSSWGNGEAERQTFNSIKTAILDKRILSFQYSSGNGNRMERIVEPLKLYFKGTNWYLYGFCRVRMDYRFFKLRRIKNLKNSEETFQRECPANIFKEENYVSKDVHTIKVKLLFSPEAAYRVYDEFDNIREQEEGYLLVEEEIQHGTWLSGWIMSFGSDCTVIEPESMRDSIKKNISIMNKNYR